MRSDETLKALCAEGNKLGLTTTEFWKQVRAKKLSDTDLITAAEETLRDLREGGRICPKCSGTGRFIRGSEDKGPCFMCRGKGIESIKDTRRNHGYRLHNPGRQEAYIPARK